MEKLTDMPVMIWGRQLLSLQFRLPLIKLTCIKWEAFGLSQNQEPHTVIAVGYLGDPDKLTETQREKEIGLRLRRPLDEMPL